MTPMEIRKIVSLARKNTRVPRGMVTTAGERDSLMIRLGLVVGCRISDLVAMKPKMFERVTVDDGSGVTDWKLTFEMKKAGRKLEMYVCNDVLMDDLNKYIKKNGLGTHDLLFPLHMGGGDVQADISERRFYGIFKKLVEGIGSPDLAPHDMRRTMATVMYQKTRDIYAVSRRMGHAGIAQTQHYLRLKDNDGLDLLVKVFSSIA